MNLSDIRTRLSDVYGSDLSSDQPFLNRVINDAYMKLCSMCDWWWLENEWIARFEAYVKSITVSATEGSASLTASSSLDSAYEGGFLWSGEHLYRMDSVSGTSITIDADWIEDSGSYSVTVWNDTLTLPSNCDRVVEVLCRNAPNRKPLRMVDLSDIELYGPNVSKHKRKIADRFAIYKRSTTLKIRIFPPPYELAEYVVRYRVIPSELSNDSDVPLLPEKYHRMLCELAIADLLTIEREDADLIAVWQEKARMGMSRMIAEQHQRGAKANLSMPSNLLPTDVCWFRLQNTEGGV